MHIIHRAASAVNPSRVQFLNYRSSDQNDDIKSRKIVKLCVKKKTKMMRRSAARKIYFELWPWLALPKLHLSWLIEVATEVPSPIVLYGNLNEHDMVITSCRSDNSLSVHVLYDYDPVRCLLFRASKQERVEKRKIKAIKYERERLASSFFVAK